MGTSHLGFPGLVPDFPDRMFIYSSHTRRWACTIIELWGRMLLQPEVLPDQGSQHGQVLIRPANVTGIGRPNAKLSFQAKMYAAHGNCLELSSKVRRQSEDQDDSKTVLRGAARLDFQPLTTTRLRIMTACKSMGQKNYIVRDLAKILRWFTHQNFVVYTRPRKFFPHYLYPPHTPHSLFDPIEAINTSKLGNILISWWFYRYPPRETANQVTSKHPLVREFLLYGAPAADLNQISNTI